MGKFLALTGLLLQILAGLTSADPKPISDDVLTFDCHVSISACSGINFRGNPFTGAGGRGMSQVNNGELLKGQLYENHGTKHLKVSEIKRHGKEWEPVSGEQWMPETGGPGNGGQWLHDVDAACCPAHCPGQPSCPDSCKKCHHEL
eukprot:gnl/TRDRNA2_/TRDRNA2_106634_c0_seq3.p1 gnl/TRDRNA2_/TRDRNA2_106634_c0~~gnl/TRDRNA2_/TRDRNA2_106634_c0_seq3.p1  ORF type:complete len:146 (-),score=18.90 gnl/TRDRNA2_/TRDRNA2_106634_c0_seq3:243-680(-)